MCVLQTLEHCQGELTLQVDTAARRLSECQAAYEQRIATMDHDHAVQVAQLQLTIEDQRVTTRTNLAASHGIIVSLKVGATCCASPLFMRITPRHCALCAPVQENITNLMSDLDDSQREVYRLTKRLEEEVVKPPPLEQSACRLPCPLPMPVSGRRLVPVPTPVRVAVPVTIALHRSCCGCCPDVAGLVCCAEITELQLELTQMRAEYYRALEQVCVRTAAVAWTRSV
jgi:hypothetical protein